MTELKERDLKQLSAYLDGELKPKEAARLETRLKREPKLWEMFQDLDRARKLVSSLPPVRPPRNFTLTPEMAGIRERRSLYPVFRFATVVAAVAFAVLVGADTFFSFSSGAIGSLDMAKQAPEAFVEVEVEEAEEIVMEEVITPTGEVMMLGEAEEEPALEMPRAVEVVGTQEFDITGEGSSTEEGAANDTVSPPGGTMIPSEEPHRYASPSEVDEAAPTETLSPEPTSIPTFGPEPEDTWTSVEPIRAAEVGLGILAVILGVVTFILRKQH
jgi:hypothetical protein